MPLVRSIRARNWEQTLDIVARPNRDRARHLKSDIAINISVDEVHARQLPKDNILAEGRIIKEGAKYGDIKLHGENVVIEAEKGDIHGGHIILKLDEGEEVVRLGLDGIVNFTIDNDRDSYWQVRLRHGNVGVREEFPRLQCMLDTEIVGLTEIDNPASGSYTSFKASVSEEEIGVVLIGKGRHRLWVKACYTPSETIDYLKLIPQLKLSTLNTKMMLLKF